MRLLHARHAAHRAGIADEHREAEPHANSCASFGQLLPLHRLSGDRGCGGSSRAGTRHRENLNMRERGSMKITEDSPPTLSALDRPNSYIGRSVPRPNLARLTKGRAQFV